MPRTSPKISFGLYALSIKQDSTLVCSDLQPFSKINDLKTSNVTNKPYITFEPDFWMLDGGYKFKPTNNAAVHVGLMSLSMSNASGVFSVPPVMTVTFGSVHNTDGLTLRFAQVSNDYADDITVAYYDASNILIRADSYTPDQWEFSTEQAVEGFKKIEITFNHTNKPYRYLRLTGIDFGKLIYLTGSDIKSARVVQEVNPLSIKLPIDTLDLTLFTNNAEFSIINPTGEYASLKTKQPLDVYERVNGADTYIGQFYLETWQNTSNNEIKFTATDRLGVLQGITCMGGIWISPINVEDLLEMILPDTPYELDADLYGEQVKGWIPVCTRREALQQIAFAIGAYITCSRSSVLQIVKTRLAADLTGYDYTITKSEKGLEQSLTLKPLVTGVEVTSHNYVSNSEETTLYEGTLTAGTHTIVFNAPMHDLSISGATILESGANYAMIQVAVTGSVLLTGQGYTDVQQAYGFHNTALDVTTPKNILSITNVTLVHSSNVTEIAQRVYDYHQQRYLQSVKLYAPSVEPGKSVAIDTLYNQQIGGVVEKMQLDLTGGFTSKTEIVGVVVQ